jgi:hypothetical protein
MEFSLIKRAVVKTKRLFATQAIEFYLETATYIRTDSITVITVGRTQFEDWTPKNWDRQSEFLESL